MPARVHENKNPRSDNSDALEIPGFQRGVDNRSPETSLPDGAAREIVNADVYRDGNIQRRAGYTLVSDVSNGHSLWSVPELDYALFVDNGEIKKLEQYGKITGLGLSVSQIHKMSWCWYNGNIYYSNGLDTGRITDLVGYSWGLPVPPSPTLTATAGSLPEGDYCVTCINVTAEGEESGAPMASTIHLSADQAVTVTTTAMGLPYIDIYVTETNGDMFYRAARVAAGSSYTVDKSIRGKLLATQFGRAPYPGSIVQAFNGRLYTASGNTIWYTDPLRPHMIFPRTNFLMFESPVTMIAPVVDGIYIGTTKRTYWLNGGDPNSFRQNLTQPYGVIHGSQVQVPGDWFVTETVWPNQGYAWSWRNTEGVLCIGRLEGFVQKINSNLIKLTNFEQGASTVIRRDGLNQVLTSLWRASDNSASFGDSYVAEVVSNNLS